MYVAQAKVLGQPVGHYLAHGVVTFIMKGEKLKKKRRERFKLKE